MPEELNKVIPSLENNKSKSLWDMKNNINTKTIEVIDGYIYNISLDQVNDTFNKLLFYKNNKIEVKFRLALKSNYEVSGEIIALDNSSVIIKNEIPIANFLKDINPLTIFPKSYNQIVELKREYISDQLRNFIFLRDNFTCKYNFDGCTKNTNLVLDHIIPISKGGESNLDNLITSCSNCNLKKSDKILT